MDTHTGVPTLSFAVVELGNSYMRRFRQGIDCSRPRIEGETNAAINGIGGHSTIILAAVVCASLAINFVILTNRGALFGADSLRYVDGADRVFTTSGSLVNKGPTQATYSSWYFLDTCIRAASA